MRDYQKEYNEYQVRCAACKQAWVPDARHVGTDGRIADCKPDNLTYLEYMYTKKSNKDGK